MIDDRLRSAAAEVRVEAGRRIPPPLRARSRRLAPVASGGLIVVALVAGVVLYSIRQREQSPTVDKPATSSTDTAAPSATSPAPTVPSSPTTVTQGGVGEIEHVSEIELWDFIGKYEIDYQDANLTLGQFGASELILEMTAHSFCVRFGDSSGCSTSADGSTLPTQPDGPRTNVGSSKLNGATVISLDIVAPDGVDLRVLNGDQAVCELQRFPLTQFGTAVVWACQAPAPGPADHWELAATKDGRTLAAPVLEIPPHPEQMPEVSYFAVGDSVMLGAEEPLAGC